MMFGRNLNMRKKYPEATSGQIAEQGVAEGKERILEQDDVLAHPGSCDRVLLLLLHNRPLR